LHKFVSLHNHDYYSIKDGIPSPIEYLTKAKEMGSVAFAQTNHGNMSGVFDFVDSANKVGIKPILGMEGYFVEDKNIKDKTKENRQHIILLAKNLQGYKTLLKSLYDSMKFGFYYKPRIDFTDLQQMSGNVIISSACSGGIIAKNLDNPNLDNIISKLLDIFGKDFYFEYVALERTKHYGPIWQRMHEIAVKKGIKEIITADVHYLHKSDWKVQEILHNVERKTTIMDLKKKEETGEGKGWIMQDKDLYLKNYDEIMNIMKNVFDVKLVEEFLDNTNLINSHIEKYDIYPKGYVYPKVQCDENLMKNKIKENLYKKCEINNDNIKIYQDRIKYEWGIIKSMGFLEYFYIVSDIIDWCKKNNIEIGLGRGSAAGSLVSYLLDITEVDSIKGNLSFERFLNPERCLHPDMLVKTKNEVKKIKDINIGDKILTLDGLYRKVKNKEINKTKKTLRIKYKDGYVECTPNHKFMIFRDKKFIEVKASEINVKDNIIKLVEEKNEKN
jgi:DNA polymerase-3 subunit alpha